jgi:hypothetical protein
VTYDEKAGLVVGARLDFNEPVVRPQYLRCNEVDAVFGFVRAALVFVEFEFPTITLP